MLTSILPRTTTQIIKRLIKDAINPQLSSPFNLVGEWVLVAHTDLWEVLKNQWPCHKWLYRRFSTAKKMPRGTDSTFRWVRARNTLTHWSYVFLALTHRLVQIIPIKTLQWGHNGCDSISNHQSHDCLLNRLFRRRSKKTSKLRVTGLCAGNSQGPVNSPHKWPVTQKMFPFDDVIMNNTPWNMRMVCLLCFVFLSVICIKVINELTWFIFLILQGCFIGAVMKNNHHSPNTSEVPWSITVTS